MAIKSEWLTKDELMDLEFDNQTDEQLNKNYGFTEYSISRIRSTAKHIREISSGKINGMRVPTHRALYLIHAQAKRSRDFHFFIDMDTGDYITKVYVSPGSWVEGKPKNSYEISLMMSDIPANPTYRELLESIINQMKAMSIGD